MTNTYPFHYEVRIKLFAIDKNNNVRNETFTRTFNDLSPLQNRDNAFDEIRDYISALDSLGRLSRDKKGNYTIFQPAFITEKIQNAKQLDDYFESLKEIEHFRESITVVLVLTDLELAEKLFSLPPFNFPGFQESEYLFNYNDDKVNELEIHKIASYEIEEQEIIDYLDDEVTLYTHLQIDVNSHIQTAYHYGVDYGESGEEEGAAKRIILKTPYIWNSIYDYNDKVASNSLKSSQEEQNSEIDLKKVIERGESNQIEFKPSLLYNFKSGKAGITPKFHIAKTICAFLNSNGGVLFVGVTDEGEIQGLEEYDFTLFESENKKDKILLEFDSLLTYFFGVSIKPLINCEIKTIDGKSILVVLVSESYRPIFMKNKKEDLILKEMYIRMNASTRLISENEELAEYIFNKEWKKPSR